MKKLTVAVFGLFVILSIISSPLFANAAEYLPKEKSENGNVTVSGDEQYRNLFVAGANVFVNQRILGDLFMAGGSANITSSVQDDLMAAGGNISLSAPIGGDARVAGGNIVINSPIAGDLMAAGGTVNIGEAASVGRDFWAGAGVLNLNSNVKGNLKVAGGEIFINSRIGGSVEIRADKKLVFGPKSRIESTVTYWGENEAEIQEGAQVNQIDFRKTEAKTASRFAVAKILSVLLLIKILSLFIASLIVLKLLGRTSTSIVSRSHMKPWAALGIGFVGLVATPIVAIILMLTAVGFLAGIILLFFYILALMFSAIFSVLFIGSLLERWVFKKELRLTWKTTAWGVIVGAIVLLIPIVGFLAMFVVLLMAFGSLLSETKSRLEF